MSDSIENMTFVSAADNPLAANAAIAAAIADPEPEIPSLDPPDTTSFRKLPAGYVVRDKVYREFEVQELTGIHEERLAKIDRLMEPGRWLQTLLECAVVSVGGTPATPDLLRGLLIGDREYLALAISVATYGPDITIPRVECPKCREVGDYTFSATDIPVHDLTSERLFTVEISKNRKVTVCLPDGHVQLALFENPDITEPERKSIVLSECVQTIVHENGIKEAVAGFPSLVRNLGVVDRNKITRELSDRQPGPRYNEIKFSHECGFEEDQAVGLMHLFPGL